MKKLILILSIVFACNTVFAQTNHNLDFEILENETAKGWKSFGSDNYKITYDTTIKQNGKISGSIESQNGKSDFKALAYTIPTDFDGKKIKLSGYLKTENVEGGFAGLWLRVDPQIGFDNMQSQQIKGTNEWTKYEIELDYNSAAEKIVFGGIIVGTGKIWVDNMEITVDGKPLAQAPEKKLDTAQKDKTFDNGSNISISSLNNNQIKNLDLLGRVWGFLKYYHPEVGKGNFNWDYELFRILPKFQNAKNNIDRDNILASWIDSLGKVKRCKSCKEVAEDAFLKPDLDWIKRDDLSQGLKEKLEYIKKNRHQGKHYYIGMMKGVKNPRFKNEKSYSDMKYPDDGFRLLSVYKYWNMINYFFPYKHLMDKDWNTCLKEYIPKFINAKDELEYELAALQMIGDIKDTHANLWGGNNKIIEQKGDYFPTFHVKFVENKLIVDAFFEEGNTPSGLELGDIITHINNKSIEDLVKEKHDFYPASNQPTRLRNISFDILQSTNNTVDLKLVRNKNALNKTLNLYNKSDIKGYYRWYKNEDNEKSFKKLDNNIGYITLKNIKEEDVKIIRKEFIDTKGIIVDIRNYPSAFMPFLLGQFFTSKTTPFVKFTNGNVNYPGEFSFGKQLSIPSKGKTYKGKVVVLVNEISQSQAEYTTMGFKVGDNVTIVGSTTAGADGNVSSINLPGGLRTSISGIGVYYPDGKETQRVGIVPDVEINPTIEGIKQERDELMEKAIEIISLNISKKPSVKN
ncbi:S41 family peptidase [Lacinutrix algicola]|uniref:S41 family peptidase n=1 Tax=Lacinutrix algicola TaxID=342954 RepID=UPI0006E27962|nr:S41 family peptidase [Lacinutrix algicola]